MFGCDSLLYFNIDMLVVECRLAYMYCIPLEINKIFPLIVSIIIGPFSG